MTQQTAMEYLQKDATLNLDMMECIRHKQAQIVENCDDGVLLYHPNAQVYMMSADSAETVQRMLGQIPRTDMIVVHQEQFLPLVEKTFGLHGKTVCRQAVYNGSNPLPEPEAGFEIRTLDESQLPFLCENYTRSDREYLKERLQSGVMKGAFFGGEMAGFMGMHAEGSMGLLEVLPQYRRRGIAEGLETRYSNALIRKGFVPYGQIIVGNEASMRLHKKLNFTFSQGTVTWLYRTDENE